MNFLLSANYVTGNIFFGIFAFLFLVIDNMMLLSHFMNHVSEHIVFLHSNRCKLILPFNLTSQELNVLCVVYELWVN